MAKLRVAVLASGRGSNLQSVLDACAKGLVNAEVVAVVSDDPDSQAMQRARKAKVPAHGIAPGGKGMRAQHEAEVQRVLDEARPEIIVLAGYMRVLSPAFCQAWRGRIVNIHPSLLPAFQGRDGQGDALAHGVKVTGCTTHFVDETVDGGPIILQAAVLVRDGDTRDTLADRVLAAEHQLLPRTIDLFQKGRLSLEGRRVRILRGDSWRTKLPTLPDVLYGEGY